MKPHNKFALVGLFLFVLSILAFASPSLIWDENAYLANARSLHSNSAYIEDQRFPLLEFVIAGMWNITGESIIAAKLLMISFAFGAIVGLYLLLKTFGIKKDSALLSVVLCASSPLFLFWSTRVYSDIPAMFLMIASILALLKYRLPFLAGFLAGLCYLMRAPYIFVMIFLLIICFKEPKKILLLVGGCIIPLIPWAIFNYAMYNNPVYDLLLQYQIVNAYTPMQSPWLYLEYMWKNTSILIVCMLGGIILIGERIKNAARREWYWAIILYGIVTAAYYLFVVKYKSPRYLFALYPFFYLCIALSLDWLHKRKWVWVGILFMVIAYPISWNASWNDFYSVYNCEYDAIYQSLDYVMQHITESDSIISNFWPYVGYYANRTSHAFWTENIEELLYWHYPNFLLVSDTLDQSLNESILKNSIFLSYNMTFTGRCNDHVNVYTINNLSSKNPAINFPKFSFVLDDAGIDIEDYISALKENIGKNSSFIDGEIFLIMGRLFTNHTMICSSIPYYLQSLNDDLEWNALIYETVASLNCLSANENRGYYQNASDMWDQLGVPFRAEIDHALALNNSFDLSFETSEIQPEFSSSQEFQNSSGILIGNSTLTLSNASTLFTQVERVSRDWLSAQLDNLLGDQVYSTFSERFFMNQTELQEKIGWHEGGRIKKFDIITTHHPITGTLVARSFNDNSKWYAPDENGIFKFEVPIDKVLYPTTRFLRRDLAMVIDTHGINMMVEQAIRKNASVVMGCCDHPGKAKAVIYLSERNISSICMTDRFSYLALGYSPRMITSAPYIIQKDKIIIGNRPIILKKNESIVVLNVSGSAQMYYDTPLRYFSVINEAFPLDLHVQTISENDISLAVQLAEKDDMNILAVRVYSKEDYSSLRNWLKNDKEHNAILFHSMPYPYGYRIFQEFPNQTSFGDVDPKFIELK